MRIFIVGVSCVGKTVVGAKLAALLGCPFFDLDDEIESFFSMPIERLQEKFLTMYSFRQEAAKALKYLLEREDNGNSVIALPPSGLMGNYWRVVKKANGVIVALTDDAANILERITFYDKDSHLIEKHLTKKEKLFYLKDIKKDITYFGRTYKRADLSVRISGLGPEQAAKKVKELLDKHWEEKSYNQNKAPEHSAGTNR